MTNHQALSERLAELLGIKAYTTSHKYDPMIIGLAPVNLWLTQDDGRMFRLSVDQYIDIKFKTYRCVCKNQFLGIVLYENFKDHTDKAEATRVAIAKAIISKEENDGAQRG